MIKELTRQIIFGDNQKTDLNYIITLPDNIDISKESLPMIVFLHGSGERNNDINSIKIYGIPNLFCENQSYLGLRCITLSPQITRDDITWIELADQTKQLIDDIAKEYNVDTDRISLTGISMGGFGTWEMGSRFPGYFSALGPICGGGNPNKVINIAKSHTPVKNYHGEIDDVVDISYSNKMVKALKAAGGTVDYYIYPECGHSVWNTVYRDSDLIMWLYNSNKKSN